MVNQTNWESNLRISGHVAIPNEASEAKSVGDYRSTDADKRTRIIRLGHDDVPRFLLKLGRIGLPQVLQSMGNAWGG